METEAKIKVLAKLAEYGQKGCICSPAGIAPAITATAHKTPPLIVEVQAVRRSAGRKPGIWVVGNYVPSGHASGKVYCGLGIAPTVMDNHGENFKVLMPVWIRKPR